ncbi:alpha/beta hydrolase fold domain-containing protein [Flavobacterium sp. HJJ]|uniref:alpha/beta hydrolase fold domain-containing protein n=1 Tax=Flavobacterium sp. HJJ TaxID=2783792 RepID=UPI00188B015F|nr:alpha/beta hydrolase [Flavobacterium sp. HJJ]MBF4473768.1 alpha/beta hydrolase [Flavobacterium sp. HJJ]
MKKISKLYVSLSILILSVSSLNAQSIPDSIMTKINNFRGFYETLGKTYPVHADVKVDETTIAGVKSFWFNKNLLPQKKITIYLHGGVYTYGSINAYRSMLTHLSASLNTSIVYVEYSLSPEHPYPTANNEVLNVYRELTKNYPNHKISIIGDSAGGGLAVYLVNDAQKANLPMPSSLALISPWIDLKCDNESYTTKQSVDPILKKDFLYSHALMYAADKIKEADPSEIKFKKFLPVFLLVGTDEVLNDDSKNFYSYIKPIQQKAKFKEFVGQKHVWLFSHIDSKESVQAMSDIKEFISAN